MNTMMYTPAWLAAIGLALACVGQPAFAQSPQEAKPLELRRIMQNLGAHMQAVTAGIAREDWVAVARIAPEIARHPEPPGAEKGRIVTFMGADMGRFKGYDNQSHEAALAMGVAAGKGDGEGVITTFAKVQGACLSCHKEFRQRFVEHFYGKR
jgi:cytochrome c556